MMIDETLLHKCRDQVAAHREQIIQLTRQMVTTPSLSGNEGPVAEIVRAAMQTLDFDEVWTDAAGNVIGVVRGGDRPATLLNGHMDVVDTGNPDDWEHPPFGAEVHDGLMWGRGSADMKGGLASMIFAAGLLKQLGHPLPGDVFVAAVGLEEVGGWGTRLLLEDERLKAAGRAVVGEPTQNRLLPGHRLRMILKVSINGPGGHASLSNQEANPVISLARFICGLPQVTAALRQQVGYLTITPTTITSFPTASNVITPEVTQALDIRADPGTTPDKITPELQRLLQQSLGRECWGQVQPDKLQVRTYTGITLQVEDVAPGCVLPEENEWLKESRAKLAVVLGEDPLGETARFTCDASRLYEVGIPPVIFGPGDITLAHSSVERVPLEQIVDSTAAYMALVL